MPRIKRPRLKREGPIRSWPSAMGADAPDPLSAASARPQQASAGSNQDPIRRGVVMGGQVVDEWMKQGQHMARMLGTPPMGAGWPDASGRMMKAASDFMAAWMTSFATSMQPGTAPWNGVQAPPHGNGSAARPNSNGDASGTGAPVSRDASSEARPPNVLSHARITLDVTSKRPVEISIALQCQGAAKLRVLDLRPDEGDAPRIRAPQLDPSGEGWRLRISVPADQPPGTYHATIIDDAADFGVGSVTVKVRK